jgi:WD40 repeat protein
MNYFAVLNHKLSGLPLTHKALDSDKEIGKSHVWSPDDEMIASGNAAVVLTYGVTSGKSIHHYEGHQLPLYDMRWERDGLLFCVGGEMGVLSVLNATNRSRVFQARASRGVVQAAAMSPDGRRIAFAHEGERMNAVIEVRNTTSHGTPPIVFSDHPLHVRVIAFSPDGCLAASTGNDGAGSSGMVRIWDTSTGKRRKLCVLSTYERLSQGENNAYALAFSPDGKYLATANADSSIQVFAVTTGKQVASYHGHRAGAFAVAFSPDGKYLASGGGDNTARIWRLGF